MGVFGRGYAFRTALGAALSAVFATFALACGATPDMQWEAPPAMEIDPNKAYTATFHLEKDDNSVVIELFAKQAPVTVNSFVFLARQGYYDNVTFHRVIPGFMAQTGDPTGSGSGGPGYTIENEFSMELRHDGAGVISMANAGMRSGKATNGSQFFITYGPQPSLDGLNRDGSPKNCAASGVSCHSVFGRVIGGMEYVEQIRERDPSRASFEGDRIKTIQIEELAAPESP